MTWQNGQVNIYISFLFFSFLIDRHVVIPDSHLGNKSDIFHYNSKNN